MPKDLHSSRTNIKGVKKFSLRMSGITGHGNGRQVVLTWVIWKTEFNLPRANNEHEQPPKYDDSVRWFIYSKKLSKLSGSWGSSWSCLSQNFNVLPQLWISERFFKKWMDCAVEHAVNNSSSWLRQILPGPRRVAHKGMERTADYVFQEATLILRKKRTSLCQD